MRGRPISVILVAVVYITAGTVGFIYHLPELRDADANDAALVLAIRLLAVIGGVFALRRANWARWLLVAWITYHVILSLNHNTLELAMHLVVLAVTLLALFNRKAWLYFSNHQQVPPPRE